MKLIMLNGSGHTTVEAPVEDIIREVETWMNRVGPDILTLLAEPETGTPATRVEQLDQLRSLPDTTRVWVFPKLVGGEDGRSDCTERPR